ncbi:hypothetical protein [Variovorax sp. efr-133-TYG-130]|uniref:hypothetical protein n=1 Tax=Variovorax sp. efr-133-TYG-130 TaxID=3040327 RepID=UPI002553F488|nr:hypothetical protein [Variovorax sp. efr-133-TYG-130]
MPIRHARIFPRHAFHCVLGGVAVAYALCAVMLMPARIFILPFLSDGEPVSDEGMLFLASMAVPAGLYLMVWRGGDFFAWWRTPPVLTLGAHGLQLGRRTVAFADVTRLRHRHGRDHMLITTRSGKTTRLRLGLWDHAAALRAEVEEAIGKVLRGDVERRMHAGDTVDFGALAMNAEGLVHEGQLIAWSSIDTVHTQSETDGVLVDEHLVIIANGRTRRIDRSKIENEPVLLACLMQRLPAG